MVVMRSSRRIHPPVHSVRAHLHLAGTNPQKEFPSDWIIPVNAVQNRRLRIEREVASSSQRNPVGIPYIAHATKGVCPDAK